MPEQPDSTTTATDAQWDLPDTDICSAARQLVIDVSPAALSNHCVRSYLFGRELGAADGVCSGADYDDETLFLACMLHDLGVTEYGRGDQRFEVDGADAAAGFLRERGVDDDRVTTVWQSIALHSSIGLADRFGVVPRLAHLGISLDVDGMARDSLPPGFADRVVAAWPRHDLGYALAEAIARDTKTNPRKAPPFSLPAHLHEVFNGPSISFLDVVANSGWGDRPPGAESTTS
jgi:hypothetical protein